MDKKPFDPRSRNEQSMAHSLTTLDSQTCYLRRINPGLRPYDG